VHLVGRGLIRKILDGDIAVAFLVMGGNSWRILQVSNQTSRLLSGAAAKQEAPVTAIARTDRNCLVSIGAHRRIRHGLGAAARFFDVGDVVVVARLKKHSAGDPSTGWTQKRDPVALVITLGSPIRLDACRGP